MNVFGDPSYWSVLFPEELIPDIIDLVTNTWEMFPKPAPDDGEVPITQRFRIALIKSKRLVKLLVRIERESYEDDLETGEHIGRLDLKFIPPNSVAEENYFTFECKRLNALVNGTIRRYASEYVQLGMMCFSDEQYAYAQVHGGMIGYVLDGDVAHAVRLVAENMAANREALKMRDPARLEASSLRPANPAVNESSHHLDRGLFRMHHVFLSC